MGWTEWGIESLWGLDFWILRTIQTSCGPLRLLYSAYWVSFLRIKQLGHGVDYPLPSSVEVKRRVELYLYSSSMPSWPAVG
jgi:hypothetical protein